MYFQITGHLTVYLATNAGPHQRNSKVRISGSCEGNSPVTGDPAQRASNVEKTSIWWRHHTVYWDLNKVSVIPSMMMLFINTSLCVRLWSQWVRFQTGLRDGTQKVMGYFHNIVRCRYNAVNFLQNPHHRHPIASPFGLRLVDIIMIWNILICSIHG